MAIEHVVPISPAKTRQIVLETSHDEETLDSREPCEMSNVCHGYTVTTNKLISRARDSYISLVKFICGVINNHISYSYLHSQPIPSPSILLICRFFKSTLRIIYFSTVTRLEDTIGG